MNVLIIGGTRFIGPWVVRAFVAQGHNVTVFHRGRSEADLPEGVQTILGDRDHLPDFRADFERAAPEVVVDMMLRVENDGRLLMDTFRGLAKRVTGISSIDVYRAFGRLVETEPGPPETALITEDSPLRENWYPYRADMPRPPDDPARWRDDYDKIPIERILLGDSALPGTVLRLPMTYGPGDYQRRLLPYLKRMDDGRHAILLEERLAQWRTCRGYVENVADAIVLAATDERAAGHIYNIAEQDAPTEAEWVERIGRVAGWHGRIVSAPAALLPPALTDIGAVENHLAADSSRIRRELGYMERVSQDEALRRTVAWDRANPPETFTAAEFDYPAEDAALAALGA